MANRSDFTERSAKLSATKQELLKKTLGRESIRTGKGQIARQDRQQATVPLSFAQQRVWFLEQLEAGKSRHNISRKFPLKGPLNTTALERSLDEVVQRHEVLRTTFDLADVEPVQVIASSQHLSLPIIDLIPLPEAQREAEAERLALEEAQLDFDLARGPLLRAKLFRLAEQEHLLLLTMHHIISDGWSMGVLFRELAALYEAFNAEKESPLPPLPIQYADYAVWQRDWLRGEELEKQLAYWKQQLAGIPVMLDMPLDSARPAVPSFRGTTQTLMLPKTLTREIKTLSLQEGVTLFMTLLAAFQVLLARYSKQSEIVVGSPVANRNRTEIEGLIGFFVNTLALRTDASGDPSVRELLSRVREVCLGAYANQDVPFERVVEEVQPERSLSYTPLFQVMFALQNATSESPKFLGFQLLPERVESGSAIFDLMLDIEEQSEGLRVTLQYNTDLFEGATATRLLAHYQRVLEGFIADPKQSITQIALLSDAERHKLLVEWNQPRSEYPGKVCVHELFETQTERTAEQVAIVFGEEEISYRELNRRANQVAHYLHRQGVGVEQIVGVLMERSIEMVVALLGILKAGAAYLPLDSTYPPERLGYMMRDSEVGVVLTQGRVWREKEAELGAAVEQVLRVDDEWAEVARESTEPVESGVRSGNLAYVIYTSGSTGTPKGVSITHQSAVVFLNWATAVFTPEALSGVLAATSISFDLSIFELFAPLSSGGRIILVENALHLASVPAARKVTLINTVPSAMAELVRMKAIPESVRVVNLAGEALRNQLVQEIYEQGIVHQVFNLYGPSEDTTYSTYTLTVKGAEREPTIGRPISNTQVYVLDEGMEVVPVGVVGEMYIGGDGLARGYLKRPDLTAERFVPHPYGRQGGERLYRTGDMVKWRASGEVEFVGRADGQVKVRGYRIELGEIQAVLMQHPAVYECVVTAREDVPGDKRVAAYVKSKMQREISGSELRDFLKERLPAYMIPTAFVVLGEFPLTANGKLDIRALPVPDQTESQIGVAHLAPRTPVEEMLAETWAKVLNVEGIGVYDNFFHLGGHSLLATQVVSRVRKATGINIPLRTVFEAPTIAAFAEAVERAEQQGRRTVSPSITRIPRETRRVMQSAQSETPRPE